MQGVGNESENDPPVGMRNRTNMDDAGDAVHQDLAPRQKTAVVMASASGQTNRFISDVWTASTHQTVEYKMWLVLCHVEHSTL